MTKDFSLFCRRSGEQRLGGSVQPGWPGSGGGWELRFPTDSQQAVSRRAVSSVDITVVGEMQAY